MQGTVAGAPIATGVVISSRLNSFSRGIPATASDSTITTLRRSPRMGLG